jgi:hypothetical protein
LEKIFSALANSKPIWYNRGLTPISFFQG